MAYTLSVPPRPAIGVEAHGSLHGAAGSVLLAAPSQQEPELLVRQLFGLFN